MTANVFACLMLGLVLVSFVAVKGWQFRKLRQENDRLQAQNQQQSMEIQTQKEVLKNANIQQKHREAVTRASNSSIDQQLQERGYFRD